MAPRSIEVDADQLDALCRRYGVAALFLFGSVARGDDRPGSDLDLLYDTAPGARLGWEIDDFADELAAPFGRPVDLVSRWAINPRLRGKILHDARPLYAAGSRPDQRDDRRRRAGAEAGG